jgi:hypothetical protein
MIMIKVISYKFYRFSLYFLRKHPLSLVTVIEHFKRSKKNGQNKCF